MKDTHIDLRAAEYWGGVDMLFTLLLCSQLHT